MFNIRRLPRSHQRLTRRLLRALTGPYGRRVMEAHRINGTWEQTLFSVGVYNVKGYGARGDNSNDDTSAIQAAIDAAAGAGGELRTG